MATRIKTTTKKRAAKKRSALTGAKSTRSKPAAPSRKQRGAHAALGKSATKHRTPSSTREKTTRRASSRDGFKQAASASTLVASGNGVSTHRGSMLVTMLAGLARKGRSLLTRLTPESWQTS
jgi:hypothetical protein